MKKLDLRTLVMLLCVASMTVFASCDNKGNEPDDPQGGSTENNGGEETPAPDPYNGHAYVDLGLPSGLKWATCNVGTTTPEGYGDYFAWGETTTKTTYDWSTYFDTTDGGTTFLKYNNESGKTTLDKEDDAAAVNMGGSWRMPTLDEFEELKEKCAWVWTNINGVDGFLVDGPNGNEIFLPTAGYKNKSNLSNVGLNGYYWSSLLDVTNNKGAYYFSFDSSSVGSGYLYRYVGRPVRGVIE